MKECFYDLFIVKKIECQNFRVSKYPTLNINGQHDQQAKPNISNEWKKLVIM